MFSRSTDPQNVRLRHFRAFESNVFRVPDGTDPGAFDLPFDPAERRRVLRERARASGGDLPEVEEEVSPESHLRALREKGERFLEEARVRLAAAGEEAAGIVEHARVEADAIVQQARRESEAVEAQAYQAGFAQGEDAGRRLGDQKIETVVKSLRMVVDDLVAQHRDLLAASEVEVVKLAVALALKIMYRELRQDPSAVLDVVRAAIARVQGATRLTVFVSPSDFQFLEGHLDDFRRLTDSDAPVVLEPDPAVGRGGCRVRSDTGEIDATLRTMVRAFLHQVMDELPAEADVEGERRD